MAYWIFMFRPDTYKGVKTYQTVGVRHGARKRFGKIRKGDKFVAYIAKDKVLDGYGEITSDPFEDNTLIFSEHQIYEHRCRVKFNTEGKAAEAGDLLWHLSPFSALETTTPANMIFCYGGFMPISENDYQNLVSHMDKSIGERRGEVMVCL